MKASKPECLVITGLLGAGLGWSLWTGSVSGYLGSFGLMGVGEVLRRRRDASYSELFNNTLGYLQTAIAEVREEVPVVEQLQKAPIQIASNCLNQVPLAKKLSDRFLAKMGLSTEWFDDFNQRSSAVLGESKDGKTFLLKWMVQDFLIKHPEGKIVICDIDYGQAHHGTEPNYWFHLPVGSVVFIDSESIADAILMVNDDLEEADQNTPPTLLLIDEWVSTFDSWEADTQEKVLKALKNINVRGLKRGRTRFVLGLHDTAVEMTGLRKSFYRGIYLLFLYGAAQSSVLYQNTPITPAEADEVISEIKKCPRVIDKLRPCVVYADKTLAVKAIPHLEVEEIEVVPATELQGPPDPIALEIAEWWTDENELKVLERMRERVAEEKQPIAYKDLLTTIGFPTRRMVSRDQVYVALKSRIAALGEESFRRGDGEELDDEDDEG